MIFIKLMQMIKRKDQKSQKNKVKVKNKKKIIKKKLMRVKRKYKLLRKLKGNINNQQKVGNIQQISQLQLRFNFLPNLPNILMDYAKISVLIVKRRTKQLKNKEQIRFFSSQDKLNVRKIYKHQNYVKNPATQFPAANPLCTIPMQTKPTTRVTVKNT